MRPFHKMTTTLAWLILVCAIGVTTSMSQTNNIGGDSVVKDLDQVHHQDLEVAKAKAADQMEDAINKLRDAQRTLQRATDSTYAEAAHSVTTRIRLANTWFQLLAAIDNRRDPDYRARCVAAEILFRLRMAMCNGRLGWIHR